MCLFGFLKLSNDFPSLPSSRWILKSPIFIMFQVKKKYQFVCSCPIPYSMIFLFVTSVYAAYYRAYFFTMIQITNTSIRYEQRFLSCMAFSVYDIDRVACQSRSWFVLYALNKTNQLRDWQVMPTTS